MKRKKNKEININQKSFYFEDYLETNQKKKKSKNQLFHKIEFTYFFFYFFH